MTKRIVELAAIARAARWAAALGQQSEHIENAKDGAAEQAGVAVADVYRPLWQD
jgi:hypothetical protein